MVISLQRTSSGNDGFRVLGWLISKQWTMHRSVSSNSDVFAPGFSCEHFGCPERLHSEARLQGRLKSCKCSQLGSACWERTFAVQGKLGASRQLLIHISVLSFLCKAFSVLENSKGSACFSVYSCSTHSCLWDSLLPEANDLEAS